MSTGYCSSGVEGGTNLRILIELIELSKRMVSLAHGLVDVALIIRTPIAASSSRNILPCGIEAPASISKEAFLLSLLGIFVKLSLVQPWRPEQSRDEDDEVYSCIKNIWSVNLLGMSTRNDDFLPRKKNCAQKNTIPKNGKLRVMRFRKVLTTLGVQTRCAAGLSVLSEHGLIRSLLFEQSG